MARRARSKSEFTLPPVVPGDWEGEIFGSGSVNLGQVVQPGPPRQSVEFSYIVLPASLHMPSSRFRWPGVVMIMAPTPMKTEVPDAGVLFANKGLPSLHLSLDVTRRSSRTCCACWRRSGSGHFTSRLKLQSGRTRGPCIAGGWGRRWFQPGAVRRFERGPFCKAALSKPGAIRTSRIVATRIQEIEFTNENLLDGIIYHNA